MNSYSQYGEDRIYVPLLAMVANMRFLDIGAWDPQTFSNTRALVEAGWRGVYVEPSPGPLARLVREYGSEHTVIGGAVTVAGGFINLQITDDAVSMPAEDAARNEQWAADGGFYGSMRTLSISLEQLFTQFGGDFEFVSIDTEGTSYDLFAEMIRLGPRPRIVMVEHDSRFVEVQAKAEEGNYRLLHMNGTNCVYEWTGAR